MVQEISKNLGKKVNLKISGDQGSLDMERLVLLEEAIVHILRNSLDHGLEIPEERIKKGKKENGLIEIKCSEKKGIMIKIVIQDDGKGINTEELCRKAISSGVLKPEEVEKFTEEEKLNIMFRPSFSTKEEVSEISGRGIGMDAVKKSLESIEATLKVFSKIDEGTCFTIEVPSGMRMKKPKELFLSEKEYLFLMMDVLKRFVKESKDGPDPELIPLPKVNTIYINAIKTSLKIVDQNLKMEEIIDSDIKDKRLYSTNLFTLETIIRSIFKHDLSEFDSLSVGITNKKFINILKDLLSKKTEKKEAS